MFRRVPRTKEGLTVVYHTESKFQAWRAVALFPDGAECLLYLGRSMTQVRDGCQAAYEEILDAEEQARVQAISLQCWNGVCDAGRWLERGTLAPPSRSPLAGARCKRGVLSPSFAAAARAVVEAAPGDTPPVLLPFSNPAGEDDPSQRPKRSVTA